MMVTAASRPASMTALITASHASAISAFRIASRAASGTASMTASAASSLTASRREWRAHETTE